MMIPVVNDWAKRTKLPVGRLMMVRASVSAKGRTVCMLTVNIGQRSAAEDFMQPLSYAAVLGGTCSIIGTSTNLIVQSLLKYGERGGLGALDAAPLIKGRSSPAVSTGSYGSEKEQQEGVPPTQLGFFEIAIIGAPLVCAATVYIVVASPYLLPDRSSGDGAAVDRPREFATTIRIEAVRFLTPGQGHRRALTQLVDWRCCACPVPQGSQSVGQTIEQTGLYNATQATVHRIVRDGKVAQVLCTVVCARSIAAGADDCIPFSLLAWPAGPVPA